MSREHEEPNGSAAGNAPGSSSAAAEPATAAGVPEQEELQAIEQRVRRTRVSETWVAIIVSIVVLVLLLIFILENLRDVTVTYLGASGQLPLGVALLFAAIGGALIVALVGVTRLTQLRLNARRRRRRAGTHHRSKPDH